MKVSLQTDDNLNEIEIVIKCQQPTPRVERIISLLRILDLQLTGKKNGETHILDIEQVLYGETVERKLFLYTLDGVYETNLKLYELEERLSSIGFLRISKSTIVNLARVKSLKSDMNRKIRLTLEGNEKLIVSRQYAEIFKKRLGGSNG